MSSTNPKTLETLDKRVGRQVRHLRERAGISVNQAASQLNIAIPTYRKYEEGSVRISAGRLFLLAQAFAVSVNDFFVGLPDMPADPSALQAPPIDPKDAVKQAELRKLIAAIAAIESPRTRQELLELIRLLAESPNLATQNVGG
ncbi:MAG: helix-turn-helix domain-containing protein [Magnetospiraceae bacterium]